MAENAHLFYDIRLDGFFPDTHDDEHGPSAVLNFQTEITEWRHTLVGGKDGYIRWYSKYADTDDGVAITSYVLLPPMRLAGDEFQDGMLMELIATIPERSGDVDWEVRVGHTHEEVATASAFTSGSWTTEGLQHTERVQARGGSATVKLSNGQNLKWAYEQIIGVVRPVGRTTVD